MHAAARSQPWPAQPLGWFFATAALVYAGGAAIVRALPGFDHPQVIAASVAFDLTFTVTFLAWLFPVRRRAWPASRLLVVFLVTVAIARRIVPAAGDGFFAAMRWLAAPAELTLLGWIGWRAVGALRARHDRTGAEGDLLERIRAAARAVLPSRTIADVLAFELAVLAYALGPRRPPHAPSGSAAFFYHRRVPYGPVVAALAMVVLAETVPVHLLVSRWQPSVAWAVSLFGLYTLFYLVADWRAAARRPVLVGDSELRVRTGLRWTVRVPISAIAAIERRPSAAFGRPLRAVLLGGANLWLNLREPAVAEGPYGRTRRVTSIALGIDEPDRLEALLAARRGA